VIWGDFLAAMVLYLLEVIIEPSALSFKGGGLISKMDSINPPEKPIIHPSIIRLVNPKRIKYERIH
jgi:hypothetical protein